MCAHDADKMRDTFLHVRYIILYYIIYNSFNSNNFNNSIVVLIICIYWMIDDCVYDRT